jgi:hypothetical protein
MGRCQVRDLMVVFGAGTAEEWHCFGGGRVGFGG